MRIDAPWIITFGVSLLLIVAYFVPPLEGAREQSMLFFNILAAFGLVLGAVSLMGSHTRRIRRRVPGWGYSIVCLSAFVITSVVGLFKLGSPAGIAGNEKAEGSLFAWIYDHIYSPTDATFFSLLAFFIASAAFRAFRVRSVEATVMLVSAFVILLGRTFLGTLMTAWLPVGLEALEVPNIIQWLMSVPLTAGNRAIMIGIALGTIATSLRIILGVERPYAGGGD